MNSLLVRLLGIALPVVTAAVAAGNFLGSLAAHALGMSGSLGSVIGILFFLSLIAAFVSYFEYHGFGKQDGIVRHGAGRCVAITFDDGPSAEYTPKVLDTLKQKGVRATFFCLGVHVEKYPEVARRIVEEGHDIGNHTYSHQDLFAVSKRVVEEQLRKTDQAIFNVTGVATSLFRPPRGLYSESVRRIVVDRFGFQMILWTISTLDWRHDMNPKKVVRRVMRYVHPGAILLFHDSGALFGREGGNRTTTVESLPMVIDALQSAGYEIVPVSEMLERMSVTELEPERMLERA